MGFPFRSRVFATNGLQSGHETPPYPPARIILLYVPAAPAAKVKVWHHPRPADYDKAQFKQAVVTSEGTLRLSRQLKPLADLKAAHVWDVVEDKDGNLFVATGDEGKLFKVTRRRQGDRRLHQQRRQPGPLPAAGARRHGLRRHRARAARSSASPPTAKARSSPTSSTPTSGAWPTIPRRRARLRRHRAEGPDLPDDAGRQGERLLRDQAGPHPVPGSRQATASTPAPTRAASSTASTRKGKGFVALPGRPGRGPQPARDRRRRLRRHQRRRTEAARRRRHVPRPASGGDVADGRPTLLAGERAKPTARRQATSPRRHRRATTPGSIGQRAQQRHARLGAVPPAGRRELALPHRRRRHRPRALPREAAWSSLAAPTRAGCSSAPAWTASSSRSTRRPRNGARSPASTTARSTACCRRKDGSIVLGTGDPGKLYVLEDRFAAKGTVLSEVLDAKLISNWGACAGRPTAPAGTRPRVAVRSGNVAEPDDTWSDWSAEQTDRSRRPRSPRRRPATCSTASR